MSAWAWLAIGLVCWVTLSTVAGLVVAAILCRISRDASEALAGEAGASTQLARERPPSLRVSL